MLGFLGETAQGFNDWRWVTLTPLPAWALLALAALLVVAWAISARALRQATRRVRWVLLGLRGLAAALLLLLLLEPGVELLATVRERGRVAVLLDASTSMVIADGDTTRWAQAVEALQAYGGLLRGAEAEHDLEVYRFGAALSRVGGIEAATAAPDGEQTRLLGALEALAPDPASRRLSAVVLISDGGENVVAPEGFAAQARTVAQALGAPIIATPVGGRSPFRDLAIERIVADDFAFVRNSVEIQAEIATHGLDPQTVPVTLREGGAVVAVAQLSVDPAAPAQRVSFRFAPTKTGKKTFVVEAPVLEGEAIVENNRRAFTLKVIRDRLRVLQVAGRPSWDERFLRLLLKANPSVDLISFFILRTHSDLAGRDDELSLIPFPTEELFTQELSTFDVVIFQNFNFGPYQMGQYLGNVRDFVLEQGGGFAMVGGDLSFSEAGYGTSPLTEVLPVVLPPAPGQYERSPYGPQLTPAGREHPILDLERGDLAAALARLPRLQGFNLSAGLAPGSQALLEHPYQRVGGAGAPVVAVREVGHGRTAAVLTDDTWFWSLPDAGAGGRGTAHRRFWANVLRWLVRDPDLSRLRVEAARRAFAPGEPVSLRLRAMDASYRPQPGAALAVELLREDRGGEELVLRHQGQVDADGELALRLPPQASGNYRVRARGADAASEPMGVDEDVFVVRSASPERVAAQPRPDNLELLARASGGQLVADPARLDRLPLKDARRVRVHRTQRRPLWDQPLSLLLLTAVLGVEWWVRRRWGYS